MRMQKQPGHLAGLLAKRKKRGKSRSNAVICPACESIWQAEIYFFLVVIRSNKHPIKNPTRVPQV
ncbi:MAG: hypothetical protein ACLR40_07080, partial [Oscillospiraceae bacterium]